MIEGVTDGPIVWLDNGYVIPARLIRELGGYGSFKAFNEGKTALD